MADAVEITTSRKLSAHSGSVAGTRAGVLPLFAITIFLGAVLVFGVQPIAARMLLPYFGGSPAVWSASSLFFQLALLGGYGYSFLLTRYAGARFQPLVHLPVLALPAPAAALSLPLTDTSLRSLPPRSAVMSALAIGLGLPFVARPRPAPCSSAGSASTVHRWADDPYFLYAASNAGTCSCSWPIRSCWNRAGTSGAVARGRIGYLAFAGSPRRGAGGVPSPPETGVASERPMTLRLPPLRLCRG